MTTPGLEHVQPPPFSVLSTIEDGTATVALAGEIDLLTAPAAHDALGEAMDNGPAKVVLDLRAVAFMDSSGLQCVVVANRRAHAEEIAFEIVRPPSDVFRTFELTGLDVVLPFTDA